MRRLPTFVQRYQRRLFGLVLMIVRRQPAAEEAVAALTSGERTAVILYYREEMPLRDIALALGVTTGTVKTLLFRARRHLRERLGGRDGGDTMDPLTSA